MHICHKEFTTFIRTKFGRSKLNLSFSESKSNLKQITKVLNQYNTLTSSESETADVMNNYFVSVFVSDEYVAIHTLTPLSFDSPLTSIDISIKSVEDAIDKLQPTKSPGPDGIHSPPIT